MIFWYIKIVSKMVSLWLLLCLLQCCQFKYTQTYQAWKQGTFRETIFLSNTFLNSVDPCTKITSRTQYVSKLQSAKIGCSGSWCDSNGGFSCKVQPCYNMEHIIDVRNSLPEFDESYDRNILGNLVMAYSVWNNQVGNLPSWEEIKQEKKEIYGSIFEQARSNIIFCNKRDQEQQKGEESSTVVGSLFDLVHFWIVSIFTTLVSAFTIFIFSLIGAVIIFINHYYDQDIPLQIFDEPLLSDEIELVID